MSIEINRRDIIWGYVAIFFQVASGIIVLPFILRLLSAEEVGYNYLMLTISQMVAMFDAGFSPMFGKNISYIFSGATELKKEGVVEVNSDTMDLHLLATMVNVAKSVYRKLSWIVLFLLLTGGVAYTYHVTDGYTSVPNSFGIWIVYSVSTFFNLYFGYYNALLNGRGQIMEVKKAAIYSRILYIVISILLLYCGAGLMGVCIANLVAPFASRYICHKTFFDRTIKHDLKTQNVTKQDKKEAFRIVWFNTRKMSVIAVGSYCINKAGLFIAGLFMPLTVVGSYGLMLQLGGLISSISSNYFVTLQPRMAYYRVKGERESLRKEFSLAITVFLVMIVLGFTALIIAGPWLLNIIHSNTVLPSVSVLVPFALVSILESNHSLCAALIIVGNRVPPIASSLVPWTFIVILSWLFLGFTYLQLLGLVLAQGVCQLAYNNWKWPLEAMKELSTSPSQVIKTGMAMLFLKITGK